MLFDDLEIFNFEMSFRAALSSSDLEPGYGLISFTEEIFQQLICQLAL